MVPNHQPVPSHERVSHAPPGVEESKIALFVSQFMVPSCGLEPFITSNGDPHLVVQNTSNYALPLSINPHCPQNDHREWVKHWAQYTLFFAPSYPNKIQKWMEMG